MSQRWFTVAFPPSCTPQLAEQSYGAQSLPMASPEPLALSRGLAHYPTVTSASTWSTIRGCQTQSGLAINLNSYRRIRSRRRQCCRLDAEHRLSL